MKHELTEYDEWAKMRPEEKKKQLFLWQKHTLDLFLERHAIDQKQYDILQQVSFLTSQHEVSVGMTLLTKIIC